MESYKFVFMKWTLKKYIWKAELYFSKTNKKQKYKQYSQTCVQRTPLGPKNSGSCRQVVVVQR